MIVWLASYPRSGNTLARIILRSVYGRSTYTEAREADDLTIDSGAGDLTGNAYIGDVDPDWKMIHKRAEVLRRLDRDEKIFFIKTHTDGYFPDRDKFRAILLVRHGQDVLSSFAHYYMNVYHTWPRLFKRLRSVKLSKLSFSEFIFYIQSFYVTTVYTLSKIFGFRQAIIRRILNIQTRRGSWGRYQNSWLKRKTAPTTLVRFEDLIANPVETMAQALDELGLDLNRTGDKVPTFEELKAIHPKFFRKGKSGTWKTDFTETLDRQFWESNQKVMDRLGYTREALTP